MNTDEHDNELERLIHTAIGRDSTAFDFQRWKQEHRREITEFQSQTQHPEPHGIASTGRRGTMIRTLKLAAAAVIFIGVCLGLPHLGRRDSRNVAFAQILEQIDQAKAITWRLTFYNHVTSKDGRRTWVETETREVAYRAPGLYREALHPTIHGQIEHTTITDAVNLKSLSLVPADKRASIRELAVTMEDPRGPFRSARELMSKPDLEWVGKRTTANGEVNVFRRAFKQPSDNQDWSYDFWVDAKTKRLVAVRMPGADIYDPETDPARKNPIEKEWSTMTPACCMQYDIDFDAELDDSLFSLEPPPGYTVQTEQRAQVTEKEMVDYLGIMADYNDQVFPDQPYSIDSARLNEIYDKAKEDRTPAEQKLLDTVDHYKMASLNMMPTGHFIEDHTVKDTFRYLGKGVKLGDGNRIVCWYKLKDTGTYRAVYGDLSVKDVAPEDLPLPVEP
jgi:hypothetical protein